MAKNDKSLFRRLTLLFRSGPVIKRTVRNFDGESSTTSAWDVFRKTQSHVYSTAMSAYGTYDRMARYSDFSEMEYTPEISSALDIYSEESSASDEKGQVLHLYSENVKIKELLNELFLDTLNVEFNLSGWTRNLCKYGDFFLFVDVDPQYGVINAFPMPVNEVEREEGFDPKDPMAVRFRWVTQGNQVLENWQVCHFRLLSNDAFLPYGSSVLESARRIWRQLILIEDAMLVYRIVRSPERRVFKIDVGNVPPEEVGNYMEQVQTTLKRSQVVDKNSGRVDLRYNPLSVDEDYYLPVRGSESGTDIITLAGGQNVTAIEDVEYIQKKLFAALKIPKAYLGYDEGLGAKATLSQEDIRFSRTIARVQRTLLSELNKVAIIHLFSNGFEGDDLLDFELQLSNPSTIAQQQKLELYRTRFEIAGTVPEGLVDKRYIRKNIIGLINDDINQIEKGRIEDREQDLKVESVQLPGYEDMGDMGAGGMPAELSPETGAPGEIKEEEESSNLIRLSIDDDESPIKAQSRVNNVMIISEEDDDADEETELEKLLYKRKKKRERKNRDVLGPDFARITSHDTANQSDSLTHPFGHPSDLKNPFKNIGISELSGGQDGNFLDKFFSEKATQHAKMTGELKSTLKSLEKKINIPRREILTESTDGILNDEIS